MLNKSFKSNIHCDYHELQIVMFHLKKFLKKRLDRAIHEHQNLKQVCKVAKQTKSDIQNFILHLKPFSVIEVLF